MATRGRLAFGFGVLIGDLPGCVFFNLEQRPVFVLFFMFILCKASVRLEEGG